jgi:hypothetical protein
VRQSARVGVHQALALGVSCGTANTLLFLAAAVILVAAVGTRIEAVSKHAWRAMNLGGALALIGLVAYLASTCG